MECIECGGKIEKKVGDFFFESKIIGKVLVPKIAHKKCRNCDEVLISLDESKKVTDYVKQKEQEAINKLPFEDFITLGDAAKILDISKQAFSKNPRIRRGLILFAEIGGRKCFLKASVLKYKQTKNGILELPLYTKAFRTAQPPTEVMISCIDEKGIMKNRAIPTPGYGDIYSWGTMINELEH